MIYHHRNIVTQSFVEELKIVCLVPSITELLYFLGLDNQVVGITKFCVHPQVWYKNKTKIGGTKNIQLEKIRQLNPTLIIANKEENVQEQIEAVGSFTHVWLTDVSTMKDALTMIETLGIITNTLPKAKLLVKEINSNFKILSLPPFNATNNKCAYLIWQNPYMTIGGDTYIHNILTLAGFENIFKGKKRYPTTTIAELKAVSPNYLFLSSEPFPFKQKHLQALAKELPNIKIILVNGEMFSWYGSRLLETPKYINEMYKLL